MRPEEFNAATRRLRELGGQRVWSLMISLFGDMAPRKGDVIDGLTLSAIMNALDVKPEAARVALHRLRNDDWIASVKSGRISRHQLTKKGHAECAAASPRIYATPDDVPTEWQLVILEASDDAARKDMIERGFNYFKSRVYVGPANQKTPKGAWVTMGADQVPNWVKDQLEPAPLTDEYAALLSALTEFTDKAEQSDKDTLSPLETAVLRCLIVHNWRRLVLKHPILPRPLVAPDWAGHKCHQLVTDLLSNFPRPKNAELSAERIVA